MSDAAPDPVLEGSQSSWSVAWRQLRKNRLAMLGLATILALFGVAAAAPLLANGRPLYLRGHLTRSYENDVAAFRDWQARTLEMARRLRAPLTGAERTRLEANLARYRQGLPQVLGRLGDALSPAQRAGFEPAARRYLELLGAADVAGLDLPALSAAGQALETDYGRLSLIPCYELAAAPLLEVPALAEAWDEAGLGQEAPVGSASQALLERGQRLAARVEDGVGALLRFLDPAQRAALGDATARTLTELRQPDSPAGLRHAARELGDRLDQVAAQPVDPAAQLLPMQTRWPAFSGLSGLEVSGLVAYLTLLLLLLRPGVFLRRGAAARALLLLGPALAAGLVWAWVIPRRQPLADSLYKQLAREARAQGDAETLIVFAPVPFGENENLYSDRETPPLPWELLELNRYQAAGEPGPPPSLLRRLREPGEPPLTPAQARARLGRLRAHLLGTDGNGRDVLARLIIGGRVSLSVGFVAVSIYVLIGVLLGALAGYYGGWIDLAISRFTEVVICFPAFFLIITVMAVLDRPSIFNIMVVIGITRWTEVMRLVRGEFLRLVGQDFVVAGRALGLTPVRIVFRHVLPNALGPVFVAAAFGVAGAILIESALSYLGFGVPQPQASWGSVLHEAKGHEQAMWWLTIFPGLLIFLTITAYNLVGEGLRDALDPRLRR